VLLEDRVALVTGAGRGIGQATALMLAEHGAKVVVNDLDATEARQTVAAISDAGGYALEASGDLTDLAVPAQLIDAAVDGFGGLDIIVNNAGYIWNGAMHNHSDEQFNAMLDMHVGAPFRLLRAYAPWLKSQVQRERDEGGHVRARKIVNISSVSGTEGAATQIGYSAGKAAVVGLTKTLAKEWGRYNVTVNAVAFGHIQTRLTQPYDDEPPQITVGDREFRVGLTSGQIAGMQQSVPLGRSGTPEDGAGAIFLFCLPQSDYVSGQVLTCSGGL
jgi:3-oxoacyl-[acyl-carrier protein] reductase